MARSVDTTRVCLAKEAWVNRVKGSFRRRERGPAAETITGSYN
jgi:hypothetical protein